MTAKWAERLTRWPAHIAEDRVYDLSHVHPLRYTLSLAAMPGHTARDVEVSVAFSSHTFTVGCQAGDTPHEQYSRLNDPRRFCLERYELSKRLPDLARNMEKRNCFFTNRKNYFIVELREVLPAGFE